MRRVRFKETMAGYVTLGAASEAEGFAVGKAAGHACSFHLTISISDVDAHFDNDDHWADAEGWIDCELFGGRRPVTDGRFKLFRPDTNTPTGEMLYELPFVDKAGKAHRLSGYKSVADDPGLDLWSDTTRLATEIVSSGDNETVARGIVVISVSALARMIPTFRGKPGAIVIFARRFVDVLRRTYVANRVTGS